MRRLLGLSILASALGCGEPPAPEVPRAADAGLVARAPAVSPERAPSPAAAAGPRIRVPEGRLFVGSRPGTLGRRPAVEADLVPLLVPAFEIDRAPRPGPSAGGLLLVRTRAEAATVCAAEGGRLCHELEWERACKGDTQAELPTGESVDLALCAERPAACPSALGAIDLGLRSSEWTASDAEARLARGTATAVVRGGPGHAEAPAHRCGARAARDPLDGGPIAVRCCYGPPPSLAYPDVGFRRVFRDLELDDARARELLAQVPELRPYAEGFELQRLEQAQQAIARGGATAEAPSWELAPGPFAWSPAPGEEAWVIAGRTPTATIVAVIYPLAGDRGEEQGRVLHGASFVMADEVVPIALLRTGASRSELLWTACWGCGGESGAIRFDDGRIVVAQQ
ncbi:MAG: hypothetical protein IT378_08575 [Sandaracinaceae bacterium]|nr:hypothetical protein [Sandaracinaceae bacterium]